MGNIILGTLGYLRKAQESNSLPDAGQGGAADIIVERTAES